MLHRGGTPGFFLVGIFDLFRTPFIKEGNFHILDTWKSTKEISIIMLVRPIHEVRVTVNTVPLTECLCALVTSKL
jgi:hypothetical protein